MSVKVYTPEQFFHVGGVIEEIEYVEVRRDSQGKKYYIRKRKGFVRSLTDAINRLNDKKWVENHYMKANVRGIDYTLVYDKSNKDYPYLFVETKFYTKQRRKAEANSEQPKE